jgi:hypothetical protein
MGEPGGLSEPGGVARVLQVLRDRLGDFTRHVRPDGALFRNGRDSIEIREGVELRPLRAFVADQIRQHARAYRLHRLSAVEHMTTFEGEHMAAVKIGMSSDPSSAAQGQISVVLVAGDTDGTLVIATSHDPGGFTRMHEVAVLVARSSFLGLSQRNRRRFRYTAPPGWQGVRRPHVTDWLDPSFPRVPSIIRILDARRPDTASESVDRALLVQERSDHGETGEKMSFVSDSGLCGYMLTHVIRGAEDRFICEGVLIDRRFWYAGHLETTSAHFKLTLPRFIDLLRSIVPVPWPQQPSSDRRSPHMIWDD